MQGDFKRDHKQWLYLRGMPWGSFGPFWIPAGCSSMPLWAALGPVFGFSGACLGPVLGHFGYQLGVQSCRGIPAGCPIMSHHAASYQLGVQSSRKCRVPRHGVGVPAGCPTHCPCRRVCRACPLEWSSQSFVSRGVISRLECCPSLSCRSSELRRDEDSDDDQDNSDRCDNDDALED